MLIGTYIPNINSHIINIVILYFKHKLGSITKKEYEFNITFGESKTTEDLEGGTLDETNIIPNKSDIKNILKYFKGVIDQHPPKHSSIKINGQRSYNLARKDLNFETKSRKITIYEINHITKKEVK